MSERVSELDGVRGIACLLVLADHVIVSGLPPGTLPGAPSSLGSLAASTCSSCCQAS